MFKIFRLFFQLLKVIKPAFSKNSIIIAIEIIVNILVIAINVLFPLWIIDLVLNNNDNIINLIIDIVVLVILKFGIGIAQNFVKKAAEVERKVINYKVEYLLSSKILSIDFEMSENQEYLNLKSGACFAVKNYKSIDNLLLSISNIFCQIIVLIISGVYLIFNYPILIILMLVGVIGQFFFNSRLNKKLSKYFEKLFPINRRFDWLNSLKFDLGKQKDIRLFGMKDMILRKISKYNKETCNIFLQMNDLTYKSAIKVCFINALVLYLGYFLNAAKVISGAIGIGEFLMLNELLRQLNSIFTSIGDSATSSLQLISYLEPVINVLEYNSSFTGELDIEDIKSIEFRNVSYMYPNSNNLVLDDVSFIINKGDKIGIIGLNGAGKSTIVKLICGFYRPTSGDILINGVSIDEYNWDKYTKKICPVFQDFKVFDFSIKENIVLNNETSENRVRAVIESSNLYEKINKLPKHEDTMIGPQIHNDGIKLSGGEEQKLAIARAMYRKGLLYIFDEPNSSLDPMAEYKTYEQYNKMIRNDTAIFISHRMVTTKFCTKLLTIEKGKVTNFTTPENLLKDKKSLYYKLFNMQKEQLV